MTTHSTTATVPTSNASRYLQQLCKHWSHNLAVTFTAQEGTITFPADVRGKSFPGEATVTLQARETALDVLVEATAPDQLEGLKGAVASHLDRFAFREAPLAFDWC
ncbi:MAG TPA: DUF2218 domain-containing protein [Allosphingosinicella sp.]|nr:DUF2218 domain-containing protein [Allosphingosinicella sp.]